MTVIYRYTRLLSILFLGMSLLIAPGFAEGLKTITLKDGSILKGKVLELKDQVYTIETPQLGQIQLHESKITSISTPANPSSGITRSDTIKKQEIRGPGGPAGNPRMMMQIQAMQQKLLTNPEVMAEIQHLMQDPQIMEIMQDQDFLNDVMSLDPDRMQNNENVHRLMQDPQMRSLMDRIKVELNVQDEVPF